MASIIELNTIADYNALCGVKTLHPLVSVIDFSKLTPQELASDSMSFRFSFYSVSLKFGKQCDLNYGRNAYDFQDGTLVFTAPGQVLTVSNISGDYTPGGFTLLFHPDLIRGSALGQHIKEYSFFSYEVHEALHLSDKEKEIVLECFKKIDYELQQSIDKHSKRLIVSNLELFLNYCVRFYDRQFITRDQINSTVLTKFESMLNAYFESDNPQKIGIPTVSYFADQFHLSANYFGDLIKKETGKTALEYIQLAIIETAKEKIFEQGKSVNEIAYALGFKYPQHFTRLFKQKVGMSPIEYRNMN